MEEDSKPGPKLPWKHQGLVEAIIANEAYLGTPKYLSVRELAEKFDVTLSTMYTYRTRLAHKKIINVANNGQRHTRKEPIPEDLRNKHGISQLYTRATVSTDDLVRSLEQEGIISPIDRLKMLSRLIRIGSPMIKISAIKAIEELSRTSEGRVGPPPPLTEEDRVARFIRMFLAAGEPTVKAAYNGAFPSKEESEAALQSNPDEILPTQEGPGGNLLDLPTPEVPRGGS